MLNGDELQALGKALDENEAKFPMRVGAVRLIALTGLRRNEACALRWSEIDFSGSCLRLEATKTGRSTRPIGKPARDLLQSLPRLSDDWVFPNRNNTGRFEGVARCAVRRGGFERRALARSTAHLRLARGRRGLRRRDDNRAARALPARRHAAALHSATRRSAGRGVSARIAAALKGGGQAAEVVPIAPRVIGSPQGL